MKNVSGGKATISATLNPGVTTGTAVTLTYPYWEETFDAATDKFNPKFFTIQSGLLTGDNSISNHFDLRKGTGTITLTTGTATHITIADGATVTLYNLTNTAIHDAYETADAGIKCLGNAHIILLGSNSVKGAWNHAGISVPSGSTLTISGGGSLIATGDDGAAGIGEDSGSCGNLTIMGGTVTAIGGNWAAAASPSTAKPSATP